MKAFPMSVARSMSGSPRGGPGPGKTTRAVGAFNRLDRTGLQLSVRFLEKRYGYGIAYLGQSCEWASKRCGHCCNLISSHPIFSFGGPVENV